jgi:hypothetical protein
MERYLIESPHMDENCDSVVRNIHAAGYLHFFEWGCKDGVHSGWAIVEAENHERARQIVPWQVRDQARVVKLVKFEIADPEHESRKISKNRTL